MRCRKKKEGVCDALCFNRKPYNHAAFLGRLLSGDDMADEFAFSSDARDSRQERRKA